MPEKSKPRVKKAPTKKKAPSVLKPKVVAKKVATKRVKAVKPKIAAKRPTATVKPKVATKRSIPVKPKAVAKQGKKPAKKTPKQTGEVTLPTAVSRTALARSVKLRTAFDAYVNRSVYIVAYVSAACFLLVGCSFIYSNWLVAATDAVALKAQLISASSSDTSGSGSIDPLLVGDGSVNEVLKIESPRFDFLTTIPDNITENFKVTFEALFASNVRVKLVEVGGQHTILLPLEVLLDSKYRTIIPVGQVPHGYYELRVAFYPDDGSGLQIKSSKVFFMGSELEEDIFNGKVVSDNSGSSSDSSGTGGGEAASTDPVVVAVDETIDKTVDPVLTTDDSEVVRETTDTANQLAEPVESVADDTAETDAAVAPVKTQEPVLAPITPFQLLKPLTTVLSKTAVLQVSVPTEYGFVELYVRPLQAKEYRFLGLANKRLDGWKFVFDTVNLPNGDYEFQARARFDGQNFSSNAITLRVKNEATVMVAETSPLPTTEVVTTEVKLVTSEPVSREFLDTDTVDLRTLEQLESAVLNETDQVFQDNRTEIEDLLKRYAAALQTGDQVLIDTIKRELTAKREEIALQAIQNERTRDIADDIDVQLAWRLETLQERVTLFEDIRRERSGGSTAVDTDGDGISDFDEVKLYQTDPTLADSDNDGVSDGVEIAKGYNPVSAEPEAVIIFESPRESLGLERSDTLIVSMVTPVVTESTAAQEAKPVRAQISGTALPNSFVTLYIYSSPTVVTIKTDADGSFSYTFDRELEDGRHDVYVAVTDNAGAIVAQSKPFTFVKRAEAFTPVDAAESDVAVTETLVDSSQALYNTVFGLAILALGIILLMLGMSLRHPAATKKTLATSVDVDENSDTFSVEAETDTTTAAPVTKSEV